MTSAVGKCLILAGILNAHNNTALPLSKNWPETNIAFSTMTYNSTVKQPEQQVTKQLYINYSGYNARLS